jgi:hypothetical protein
MNVRLPDGTIIRNVPEGTTKAELVERLRANGYDVSRLGDAGRPDSEKPMTLARAAAGVDALKRTLTAPGSTALNMMQRVNQLGYPGMSALMERLGLEDAAKHTRQLAKQQFGGEPEQAIGKVLGDVQIGIAAAGAAGGPLMATGNAMRAAPVLSKAGSIVEGLGSAITTAGGRTGLAPSGAGQTIGNMALRSAGGATAGAVSAAATEPEYMDVAAGIGAAVPVVGAGAKAIGRAAGSIARPFSESGRQEIARRVLAESVADPAAAARIAATRQSIAPLTTAEAAMDPGVSSLQRALVNASKEFSDDLAIRQAQQNTTRFNFLHGMASGSNSPEALAAARDTATDPLLTAALANAGDVGTMGVRSAARQIGSSPAYQRKAVRSAVNEAVAPFSTVADDGSRAWARNLPFESAWGARQNMDDISRGASNRVNEQAAKAAGAQLSMLRERLTTALNKASPDFAAYSREYAQYSKNIDAAKTLQQMLKTGSTGTADMLGNPVMSGAKLTNALKAIDAKDWARLSQAQRDGVQRLATELQEAATAQTLAKAVGSNTIQNAVANQNLPLAIRVGASWVPGGGFLSPLMDMALRGPSQKVQGLLGQAMLDPAVASQILSTQPAARGLLGPAAEAVASRALPLMPGSYLMQRPIAAEIQ